MAGIKGKQLADAPYGITSGKINDNAVITEKINTGAVTTDKISNGALSADSNGRAKIASSFFDAATVSDKFTDSSIALSKLAEAVLQADGGQALTGNLPAGGNRITGLGTPTADSDAATKGYVDSVAQGLIVKDACRLATAADLPANTPSGSGVGKTLTANSNGALTVDGKTVSVNDRILVKNYGGGGSSVHNGIYTVTQVGDGSHPWILTRATDFDGSPSGEVKGGDFTFVTDGDTQADTGWVLSTPNGVVTVDTDAMGFVQFSGTGGGSYTAGAGLSLTGNQFDVELATDPGLEFDAAGAGGKLQVKVDSTGGIARESTGVKIKAADDSLAIGASGVRAAVPTYSDKGLTPSATSGDGQDSGIDITYTPRGDSMVNVLVNGVKYELGNGVKTKACYFSADGGSTARAISAITAGDSLYWNGNIAGFDLDTSDKIDLDYVFTG